MNRNRLLIIGVLALAIAAVLTFTTFRSVRRLAPSPVRPAAQIVVAAADLGIGAKIMERDVRTIDMPATDLPQGAFNTPAEVIGRGVIIPIEKNETILKSKLAPDKAGSGLPSIIPAGMRALSVRVNEVISVAGFVVPGTRVDVLLTGYPGERRDPGDVMTTTVLENIEVLAAGQKLERNEEGKPQTVTVITLLVAPDDAQKLTLASTEGKIQLVLRNPLDIEKHTPPAVKNAALYRNAAPELVRRKPGVAKTPPPALTIYIVETIKGDKRDTTRF